MGNPLLTSEDLWEIAMGMIPSIVYIRPYMIKRCCVCGLFMGIVECEVHNCGEETHGYCDECIKPYYEEIAQEKENRGL